MPPIPADPMRNTIPAGSKHAAEPDPEGQFSQHLTAAGNNLAPTGKNTKIIKNTENAENTKAGGPQSTEKKPAGLKEADQGVHTGEAFAALTTRDLQLALKEQQVTLTGQQMVLSSGTDNSLIPENLNTNQRNTQILALLNSIQPTERNAIHQDVSGKPVTTLGSLLKNTPAAGEPKTETSHIQAPPVTLPVSDRANLINKQAESPRPEITIENWQARFSHQSSNGLHPQSELAKTEGKPVLAYLSPEVEQIAAPTSAKHGSGIDFPSQPRDANSNYIHSNLPGVEIKADGNENGNKNGPHNGAGQDKSAQDSISRPEQIVAEKSGTDTPLIFSLDQKETPGLMSLNQSSSTSLMSKLPSGTEVPHSQIINQVIDRFTVNRTLESGNITLKLHPEELGELRMEIKVEQDNIKAHITTQNPQVQEILDRHLPRLREALEQQGLNLEHMKVTVASEDGSNSQLFQEHFSGSQMNRSFRSGTDHVPFSLEPEPEDEKETVEGQQNLSVLI